jgi:hypothetical protein
MRARQRRALRTGSSLLLLLALLPGITLIGKPAAAFAGPWGACGGQEGLSFDGFSSGFWNGPPQPEPNEGVSALLTDAPGYDLCSPTPQIPPPEGDNSVSQWVMVQGNNQAHAYVQAGTVYYYGGSSPQGQISDCVHRFVEMDNNNGFVDNYSAGCSQPGTTNQADCQWVLASNRFYCSIYDTNSGDYASMWSPWAPTTWAWPYWISANAEVHFWQDTVAGRSTSKYAYGGLGQGAAVEVQSAVDGSWYDACGHVYLGVDNTPGLQGVGVQAFTCDRLATWESD